ncbi:MAG: aminotransferase class III-fold pyridoxal phosphate-dependent enzyme [candidate division Zixibacteria bacterium]|nr:aminotransferase class III-fold pyridoxal phosphate-dependent enzyme [candidate division Zixibacteria bacterium]
MFSNKLFSSICNDRKKHPERLNATLERIEEVLIIVLENNAKDVIAECAKGIDNKRAYIDEQHGARIATVIEKHCTVHQVRMIADMLMDSEISSAEAVDIHETYKIPVSRLEKDIIPVRGESAWLLDNNGKAFLDMDSNYSATNLGMSNDEIALGLYNQAIQLISMKEDRVHIPRTRFLKSIHQMMPEGLTNFYWQNSGGEAVDKALKIAKAYTGNKGVVAFKGGFHGRTHGAVAVTYNPKYREPFFLDKEDWVHFVEFNDADAVEEIFKAGKAKTVILELVQGEEAGNRPADKAFAKKLREVCDKYDALMIVDEIQSGFGRTAQKEGDWFSCMLYDIVPDIMTIGKSFGGGYPTTAIVTTSKIGDSMVPGYDGSTFGGNPMAMVAAMLATRQMREKNITGNVIERSKQFSKGMDALKKKYSFIGEIRITGLMIAFELPSAEKVEEFQNVMRDNGVKVSLSTGNFVRYLPPLIMTESDTEFLLAAMDKTLAAIG